MLVVCVVVYVLQGYYYNSDVEEGVITGMEHAQLPPQQQQHLPQGKTIPVGGDTTTTTTTTAFADKQDNNNDNVPIHVIFSTGCSNFQDWQSYVFFFHAWKSGQRGTVTRIASGCRDNDAKILTELHEKQIRIMSDRFHLHLTPQFATVKKGLNFKYFNKPFGLRHWLENALGYPHNAAQHDDSIVILLDPDQMFLRPFTNDFSQSVEVWKPVKTKLPKRTLVTHGSPFAQQYGFALQWKTKVNMSHVANGTYSRIDTMDMQEARDHYSVGPPYIATARDMYNISKTWTEFVPRVHDNYPHLLAEMFGYCLASAHLNLPHRVAQGFMVSDVGAGGEGWQLVDDMPKDAVCANPPQNKLPHVIHYCQRYMLGKWFIGKYRLRKDFISCDAPLLREPPPTIVNKNHQVAPDGTYLTFKSPRAPKRNAFMLCMIIPRLNEAAIFYKQHHCPGNKANYNKTYIFHSHMDEAGN